MVNRKRQARLAAAARGQGGARAQRVVELRRRDEKPPLASRLFDAIAARSDGATAAELAAAVGADVTAVAPALEELQLDGSIYERNGRFFAL